MRLDYLCSDLYGDIKHLSLLLKINDIFNPYSIKEGDLIFYVPAGRINDSIYTDPKLIEQDKNNLVNALKSATTDGNRQAFLMDSNAMTYNIDLCQKASFVNVNDWFLF